MPFVMPLVVSGALLAASGASVTTQDGQVISGTIAKRVEGEHVVVVTPAGEAILVPWEHVRSIDDAPPKLAESESGTRDVAATKVEPSAPASAVNFPRFELAASVGYARAFGRVAGGGNGAVSDYFGSEVPLGVSLGVAVVPRVYVGAYGRYAFGSLGPGLAAACDRQVATCSAYGVAFGIEGHYRFEPLGKIEPWAGLGFGYSLDQWKAEASVGSSAALPGGGPITSRSVARGWDFGRLVGGANYRLSSKLAVGAFLEVSLSEYVSGVTSIDGGNTPTFGGTFPDKAFHEWLTFGARGVWSP